MLQEEVAARVMAPPGGRDYGPLAIAVQLRADARRLLALPPGAFRPPPKVRSALVGLGFRAARVEIADEALFERVVRAVFTQRRKTLANALQPFAAAHGTVAHDVLARAGLDGRRRPETLDLAEYARLSAVIGQAARTPVL
jgi:16S rRNA (adenine1518-N6/adenine1519-N6)-dimethyltransferase